MAPINETMSEKQINKSEFKNSNSKKINKKSTKGKIHITNTEHKNNIHITRSQIDSTKLEHLDISAAAVSKYDQYGPHMSKKPVIVGRNQQYKKHKLLDSEKIRLRGVVEAARHEKLLTERSGLLEAAEGYSTTSISQRDIVAAADITSQCKVFDLSLNKYGPYRFQYLHDGRQLLLGGRLGHLASLNWVTKKLSMEINLTETIHDVSFLSDRHMIAVAQKRYTSIYDDEGMEIHCVKKLGDIVRLGYLKHHMLLAALSDLGYLNYLDITLGKEVITIPTKVRGSTAFALNPYNSVTCLGQAGGVVSMWTPNSLEPVAQVMCHKSPISCIAFDPSGRYMVTTSREGRMSTWDARNLGEELYRTRTPGGVTDLNISQKGLVAIGMYKQAQVFTGLAEGQLTPYLKHTTAHSVKQVQFCPYEDVLGVTTDAGFYSILIPGSGEANLDSRSAPMFAGRAAREETLVRNMLEKVPAETISLDPKTITQVDVPTLEEKLEARRKLIHVTVPKINSTPRYRMKGKSGSANIARRKNIKRTVNQQRYLGYIDRMRNEAGIDEKGNDITDAEKSGKKKKKITQDKHKEKNHDNILDRF